jgi:serine/threonine protein kinase
LLLFFRLFSDVLWQEIAAKNNTIDDWFTLDTNHKGEAVSGELHIKAKLTPPPGQDNLFAAPAVPEQEDTLSGDALKAVLAQEEEFNKGKNTVADIYKVGKELGRGAFAVVKECVHKQSGRKYAVKIIDRNAMGDTNELSLQREIEIMKKVDHPNIILLRQVFEDKKHVYLVMELVTGGELFDKIVEVTICVFVFLLLTRFFAARKLHRGGRCRADARHCGGHCLLAREGHCSPRFGETINSKLFCCSHSFRLQKPENLLLKHRGTATEVKIADFGLSRMVNEAAMMKTA